MLTGSHAGDLEIQYEQGELVYSALTGDCCEVDVQILETEVNLLPTYLNRMSQGTCR